MSSTKYCLFCKAGFISDCDIVQVNGEAVSIKREKKDFIVPRSHEDYLFEDQLKSIFILQQLLDLSKDTCAEYLQGDGGGCHPSTWFTLCSNCTGEVEECYQIYRELSRWKRKLDKKKELFRNKIKDSGRKWEEVSGSLKSLFGTTAGAGKGIILNEASSSSAALFKKKQSIETLPTDFVQRQLRRSTRIQKHPARYDNDGDISDNDKNLASENDTTSFKRGTVFVSISSPEAVCSDDDWQPSDTEMSPAAADDDDVDIDETQCSVYKTEKGESGHEFELEPVAERKKFRCRFCVASFKTQGRLTLHAKAHKLPPGLVSKCDKCGWLFTTAVPKKHRFLYCPNLSKKFKCESCTAEFYHKSKYFLHRLLHERSDIKTRTCIKCGWVTSRRQMKFHMKKHDEHDFNYQRIRKNPENKVKLDEEIPYYCDHCHLMFATRSQFVTHFILAHKNVALLECKECPFTRFESKQLLQHHLQLVHGIDKASVQDNNPEVLIKEESTCPHCSEKFTTKMRKDYHIAKFHWGEQLTCPVCKQFKAKEFNLLRNHMRKHDANCTIKCKMCSKILRRSSFSSHMRLTHKVFSCKSKPDSKKLYCLDCPAFFQVRKSYSNHRRLHENDLLKKETDTCEKCGWLYLVRPSKSKNGHCCPKGTPMYIRCSLCPAFYSGPKSIRAHRKLHENKNSINGAFTCKKCGWLCFPHEKLSHKKRCTADDSEEEDNKDGIPLYCDHCHMIYTSEKFIQHHCDSAHQGKKNPLTCTFCHETVSTSQLLDIHHFKEHCAEDKIISLGPPKVTEERARQCSHCTENFSTRLQLDYHIAHLHHDVLLSCRICKYKAEDLSELMKHCKWSKHELEERIACEICSKSYNSHSLPYHLRAIHFQNINKSDLEEELTALGNVEDKLEQDTNCSKENETLIQATKTDESFDQISTETEDIIPESPFVPSPVSDHSSEHEPELQHSDSDPEWSPAKSVETKHYVTKRQKVTRNVIVKSSGINIKKTASDRRVRLVASIKKKRTKQASERTSATFKVPQIQISKLSSATTVTNSIATNAEVETSTTVVIRKEFQCTECVASYDTKQPLTIHSKYHDLPLELIYNCEKCGWAFNTKISKRHELSECPKRLTTPLECHLCPANYKSRNRLQAHLALHENTQEEEIATCTECGWLYKKKNLNYHMVQHHKVDPDDDVKNAYHKKLKSSRTDNEQEKEDEGIPYYCDHCHLIYPSKTLLVRHFRSSHRKEASLLTCEICSVAKLESKQLLQMHRSIVHGIVVPTDTVSQSSSSVEPLEGTPLEQSCFACTHCSETISTKTQLDYHIAKYHWETQLTCPICKKHKAKEFCSLRVHMRTHDPNYTIMCEVCSKVIRKDSAKTHMKLFHYKELGMEPIQCKECKMVFNSNSSLKQHEEFAHSSNQANICPYCTKRFKHKTDLELHIKAHENPKKYVYKKGPFFCKVCNAEFNVRQALYYHMKRLHSDKYLYRCENCGKGYCFENTLLDHQRTCSKINHKSVKDNEQNQTT